MKKKQFKATKARQHLSLDQLKIDATETTF